MTQGPTDVAPPRVTLGELVESLPRAHVLQLAKAALAEGQTVDRATGTVVALLVASGEIRDSHQLRVLVGTWVALIAHRRRAQVAVRRTVAANVARDTAEPSGPIELPADAIEPITDAEEG